MARTRTLAQLRTALLIRAGMNTNGTSVDLTPAVLNEIINDAIFDGFDVIMGKWADYFTKASTTPVVAGTDAYQVPSDFYKLRTLWMLDGTRYIRLRPIDLDAAHDYTGQSVGTKQSYRYRLMGRDIILAPVPASAETIKLYYIPVNAELVSDSDSITFDAPVELKYILALAWQDILDRQNLDPSPAIAKIEKYEAKLRTAADSRDAGEPFYLNPHGPSYNDDWDECL